MKKILFCVMFTNQEYWDSPTVFFVNATDRDKAYFAALRKIGFSEEAAESMKAQGHHDDVVIEVDDIIDEDYTTPEGSIEL